MEGQSSWARRFLRMDRGEYVRELDEYLRLARQMFGEVLTEVRHDFLRIPYTHLIMDCQKPLNVSNSLRDI